MVQISRQQNGDRCDTEPMGQTVLDGRLCDDRRMADRIRAIFVDVRVQTFKVIVANLFVALHLTVQLVSIGTPAKKKHLAD